jgi:hypothetical protein
LCPKPYKNLKITKLNFNTTKEEGDGNKLRSPFSLEHHHRRRQCFIARHPLLLKHREEGDDNKLPLLSMFQQQHRRR